MCRRGTVFGWVGLAVYTPQYFLRRFCELFNLGDLSTVVVGRKQMQRRRKMDLFLPLNRWKINWSVLTIHSCSSFEFFICRPHRLRATQWVTQHKTENSNPFHWTIGQLNAQVCSRFNIYVDQVWNICFWMFFVRSFSSKTCIDSGCECIIVARARVCVYSTTS